MNKKTIAWNIEVVYIHSSRTKSRHACIFFYFTIYIILDIRLGV